MPPAKLIVAVAAVMLFAQIQCVAACAAGVCSADRCNEPVPPCHKHSHSHHEAPGSCSFRLVVTPEMSQHAPQLEMPVLSVLGPVPTVSSVLPVDTQWWALVVADASPPGIPRNSSAILRI